MKRSDVIVIGGGIAGTSAAYYLAQRNVSVTLVEKGTIGNEQSSRNWGFVRQQGRDPAELPLMVAGNKIWSELEAELGADIEWTQNGILAVAGDEEQFEQFKEWVPVGREYGVPTRIVTNDDIHELIPGIQGAFVGGMYTPNDGHAEPTKVTAALADAARKHGATILDHCVVEEIEVAAGQVTGVRTDQGVISAPTVVCAAGAWSSTLLRKVGIKLPQIVVKSTAAETAPAPPLTGIAVSIRGDRGVAFRQRPGGTVYISAMDSSQFDLSLNAIRHARDFMPNYLENRRMFDMRVGREFFREIGRTLPWSEARKHPFAHAIDNEPDPNLRVVGRARAQLVRLFPELEGIKIRRAWAGMIDSTPDALPVIGDVDSPDGLLVATGFSGHGFALGLVAGLLVAELIADGESSVDIGPLSMSRFEGRRSIERRAVI